MLPSFAVERTLGKLGKWLRLLGCDVVLETETPKGRFGAHATGGRILLSRTRRVATEQPSVFIESNDPFEQLEEVARKIPLCARDLRPFSRCLICNAPIAAVEKETVAGMVPDYVWATQQHFSRCPTCRRVYWPGSHTQRSLERIQRLFGDLGAWGTQGAGEAIEAPGRTQQ
jgi:uncharacterized protein with PIN domain